MRPIPASGWAPPWTVPTAACSSAAVSEGRREFVRIAVAAPTAEDYCLPCGSCLQVLREFSADMEILAARGDGHYVSYKLSALLPRTSIKNELSGRRSE